MKFYDASKPLYLKTDGSGICFGNSLLHMREVHLIAFASKSISSMDHWHSNIEREGVGILGGLKKIHH